MFQQVFIFIYESREQKKKMIINGSGGVVEYLGNFRRRNSVPAGIIPVFLLGKFSWKVCNHINFIITLIDMYFQNTDPNVGGSNILHGNNRLLGRSLCLVGSRWALEHNNFCHNLRSLQTKRGSLFVNY